MCTYLATPPAKVARRVFDNLHPIAEQAVQIETLVLVYHSRREEDQAHAWKDKLDYELGPGLHQPRSQRLSVTFD